MTITPQTAIVGDTLPPLTFGPITRTTLALYAGASGDHNPIHIDIDFARKAGMDDVFAHGMLSMAQLGRLVTNWAGQDNVTSLSTRFSALTPVGAVITCTGEVTEQLIHEGAPHLRVRLSATLADGTQTLKGEALIRAA
ncbi:MaoC family dehydratase [Shimia sp. W99]